MYSSKIDVSSIGVQYFSEDEESEYLLTVAVAWLDGSEFENSL